MNRILCALVFLTGCSASVEQEVHIQDCNVYELKMYGQDKWSSEVESLSQLIFQSVNDDRLSSGREFVNPWASSPALKIDIKALNRSTDLPYIYRPFLYSFAFEPKSYCYSAYDGLYDYEVKGWMKRTLSGLEYDISVVGYGGLAKRFVL